MLARLLSHLRTRAPMASLGHTLFLWRLSAADIDDALALEPAELVGSVSLSPAMRRHQRQRIAAAVRRAFPRG